MKILLCAIALTIALPAAAHARAEPAPAPAPARAPAPAPAPAKKCCCEEMMRHNAGHPAGADAHAGHGMSEHSQH